MPRRRWLSVLVTLTCLPASPAGAQLLSDPSSLRHIYDVQTRSLDALSSSWEEASVNFLAVAEEILGLPKGDGTARTQLLVEVQSLADLMDSLDQEILVTSTMVRETRERLILALESRIGALRRAAEAAPLPERQALEGEAQEMDSEVERLRAVEEGVATKSPLDSAAVTLSALAHVVAEEQERLTKLRALQEELRLFLSGLRLFDETGMPPSARSGGGGDPGSVCSPSACSVTVASPADLPLAHAQPVDPSGSSGAAPLTPTSLALLHEQIVDRIKARDLSVRALARGEVVVKRETLVGVGSVGFRGGGLESALVGPKASASLVLSWPWGERGALTVEPALGGRALRGKVSFYPEVAGEVRETLAGNVFGGRTRWQLASWQKGRFLSEALPRPGYLEPGRLEGGLLGRFNLSLASRWELEGESGFDGVRYDPEEWRVLDRHGFGAALAVGWQGASRSARVSVRGSHYEFPSPLAEWEKARQDTRLDAEVGFALEGTLVVRFFLGGSWNESRLPAYDFRSGRAALVLSAPWGKGSLQAYAALAHQVYLNPGPEEARVAPSDQDSGSLLSLQYTHPLDALRMLIFRGGWSRSETGFRNDFYERFALSVHLAFRAS